MLLEPGPSYPLFKNFGDPKDEYTLMTKVHPDKPSMTGAKALVEHRATHTTRDDFMKVKEYGFNCVRLPFGYWVITGPTKGDPYVGPDMQHIDNALKWAAEAGLYVILDLHGCPGGQSNEHPCGRAKRGWKWEDWRLDETLQVIDKFCKRYAGNPQVVGVEVTNEPGDEIPAEILVKFYEDATRTVRKHMPAHEVAVLWPIYYTYRLDEIAAHCNANEVWLNHDNIALDLHYYHCFGGFGKFEKKCHGMI